jgi:hypothetical protein
MITISAYLLLLLAALLALLSFMGGFITAALCRAADDGDDVDRMFAGAEAIDRGDA